MNIKAQLCGLVVLLIIFYFNNTHNRIKLETTKAFGILLLTTILCVGLDILSLISISSCDILPDKEIYIVCKSYLITILFVGTCGVLYVGQDAFAGNNKRIKILNYIMYAWVILGSIAIAISPIKYTIEENGNIAYTYGQAVFLTYAIASPTLIVILVICLTHRKTMNTDRFISMLIWDGLWLIASCIQYFNNELLLVGFAASIGIMVIYIRLENPEKYRDTDTGYFNQLAFMEFSKQMYNEDKNFPLLIICCNCTKGKNVAANDAEIINKMMQEFISKLNKQTFIYEKGKTIIAFDDKLDCNKALVELTNLLGYTSGSQNNPVYPSLYTVYDTKMVSSNIELVDTINYVITNLNKMLDNKYLDITSNILDIMYKEELTSDIIFKAIQDDRVEVFYQPIYSIEEQSFTSAEALVRIRREDGSIIYPGEFIEVAESTGLIIKLGHTVFEKVCRLISEVDMEKLGLHYIEVNLSVVQCGYHKLATDFIYTMKRFELNPAYINLEITESASIDAKEILINNMKKLQNYGVAFSLDDFGTGNSNLNYVMEMPVEIVKFDKGMTDAYFEDDKAKYIMSAAMQMIKGLKLKTVSEGVETIEQLKKMKKLGIDFIQGYFFSKPLPEKEFIQFITEHAANNKITY